VIERSTAVGDAIAGLKALMAGIDSTLQVVDGPPRGDAELRDEAVVLGYVPGQGGISTTRSQPDFGGRVTEDIDIIAVISVYSGATDMETIRARVIEIYSDLDLALRENPTLGDRVDDAYLGQPGEWMQTQNTQGATCAVAFSIHCEAHI